MNGRDFKDLIYDQFARIAQAFAAPKRLEIIDVLAQGERDVDSLARQVAMTIANTSRHLQILKQTRLVESRRAGLHIFYRLADPEVSRCWLQLRKLAEKRSSEIKETVRRFFDDRDSLQPVSRDELLQRRAKGDVILLDVRPAEEYRMGHIPGALSIPLPELNDNLNKLPAGHTIVAYCRGPYCVMSAEAMVILRNAGHKALRLDEGLPEWLQAGLPIEKEN